MAALTVIELGRREYAEMAASQEELVERRLEGSVGDLMLLLEHPPVYTLGRRSEPSDLIHDHDWYREHGVDVLETPRGGKVTYHGPGQLVAYPIVDLRGVGEQPSAAARADVAGFVAALEAAMAGALAEWGVVAGRIEGLTGLWVDDDRLRPEDFAGAEAATAAPGVARGSIRKIGSIGLKIHRGVSSHGLSINVSCDLQPFEWINSCGIEACRSTSIAAELGEDGPGAESVGAAVARALAGELGMKVRSRSSDLIGLTGVEGKDSVA